MNTEPEIKTSLPVETIELLQRELKDEIKNIDTKENSINGGVEPKALKIPDAIISNLVRVENALILSVVTKNSPNHVKELARKSLEPTKDDLQVTREFFELLANQYAPKLLQGENAMVWLAGGFYLSNSLMKYQAVSAIVEAHGGAK